MRTRGIMLTVACTATFLGAGVPISAAAPPAPLPIDATASGHSNPADPARFTFTAPTSGVLTVAVHGDGDLRLAVTYADGAALPDGRVDRDLLGHGGTEQLAVSIPGAGDYVVLVEAYGTSDFEVGATFLPIAGREFSVDSDGPTRDQAIELAVGETYTDSEIVTGDLIDWFRITADQDGALMVSVEALETGRWFQLELANEQFSDQSYDSGDPATAILQVSAGDIVFAAVRGSGSPAGGYSLLAEYGEPDPDGTLANARELAIGESFEDTDSAPSDRADWFAITATHDGTLTITTSALGEDGPDLQLELHRDEHSGAVDFSDQDLVTFTDESLTVDVTAGQTVFVRVSTFGNSAPTDYRISAELS